MNGQETLVWVFVKKTGVPCCNVSTVFMWNFEREPKAWKTLLACSISLLHSTEDELKVIVPKLTVFYNDFISCRLDYCNALLYGIAVSQIVNFSDCNLRRTLLRSWLLKSLHWLPIRQRLTYKLATLVHKCINGRAPEYLAEFCHPSVNRSLGMRSADSGKLHVPRTQTGRLHLVIGRSPSLVHAPGTTSWCPPRLVSVILNIRKTVKNILVCLTTKLLLHSDRAPHRFD